MHHMGMAFATSNAPVGLHVYCKSVLLTCTQGLHKHVIFTGIVHLGTPDLPKTWLMNMFGISVV